MQRLTSTEHCSQSFCRYPNNIIVDLLCCEGLAGCLYMEPQVLRFWIPCTKPVFHYFGINAPSCSELGNFFKEFHSAAEKERKPWSKIINLQSSACASIDIFNCICK